MADEKVYATADDLGTEDGTEEITLPNLGKTVCVRMLGTDEMTGLTYLPDLAGFGELAAQVRSNAPEDIDIDLSKFIVGEIKYQAHAAHVAVVPPGGALADPVECESCGLEHPPSLWTQRKTRRLHREDLAAICEIAFRARVVERVLPLSPDETESASPEPVSSGT